LCHTISKGFLEKDLLHQFFTNMSSMKICKLKKIDACLQGILSNGTELAIKCLKSSEQNDIGEFLNEVALITGIKHKNLVKLIGYCVRDAQRRFLVYEYVENKNLAEALWGMTQFTSRPKIIITNDLQHAM
jgi:hypothetical protein